MQKDEEVGGIIDALKELLEDSEFPKNIKIKIDEMIEILGDNVDFSLRVHKVLQQLEDVVDDKNLPAFSRTQIYNIISTLEATHLKVL